MNNCECQKFFYNPNMLLGLGCLECAVCGRVLIEPKKIQQEETEKEKLEKDIHTILFKEIDGEQCRPYVISGITTLIMARFGKDIDGLNNQIKYLEEQLKIYSSPSDKK
jgi:hypothetical protein